MPVTLQYADTAVQRVSGRWSEGVNKSCALTMPRKGQGQDLPGTKMLANVLASHSMQVLALYSSYCLLSLWVEVQNSLGLSQEQLGTLIL